MNTLSKLLIASAVVVPGAVVAAAPANAQAVVATADLNGAVGHSKAYTTANAQIQATYKAQLDQATARRNAMNTELTPLLQVIDTNKDGQISDAELKAAQDAKRPELLQIQQKQQAAASEIQRLETPAARAQAYAVEQIQGKLSAAVQAVLDARKITMLVKPDSVLVASGAADLTTAITAQLDAMLPSVSTVPPAGWQPATQGDQGQQGAAAGAAPRPAAPAGQAPATR